MAGGTASASFAAMLQPIAILFAAATLASAVEIRVATFNIGAHFNVTFFDYSLGDAGTPSHDTVRDILDRMDADVVALQEIHSDDVDELENPNDLQVLAAGLGYPYVYVAPNDGTGGGAPFDTTLRNAFLSRYPFLTADSIRSPALARELARLHPVVKVDVPGTTNDPVLIGAHLKSGDGSNRFRRAVEMKRLTGHLTTLGLTNADNFIVMGDFNLNPNYGDATYASVPTTTDMPGSYDLGADIPLPVQFRVDPLFYFTTPGVTRLDPRQLNGSAVTLESGAGYAIDLLLVSPALAGRGIVSEVYNSALDSSNSTGLPKAGSPLASGTSVAASDHYAVFADVQLDPDLPDLGLVLSAASVAEGQADGTVTATVTLPAVRPAAVTVTVSSDDPHVVAVPPTVVIPAGSLSGNVAVKAPRNFIAGPTRGVTFTATAPGHDPASSVLQVANVDGPYVFTSPGQTVVENFNGFSGGHDPAPWTTSGGFAWRGIDNGSSSTTGLRVYGNGADASLGFLPQGAGTVASATFVNQTAVTLSSLQIAFDVEQWRSAFGGTADTLSAALHFNGQTIPLPALSHAASQSLPSGAVAGGLTTAKSATVSGLSIPPGGTFELRVTFTPGPGGGVAPADVFVNEFHYNDISNDGNEFLEIAVAPGFSGTAADIDVVPYNGATAAAAVPYSIPNFGSVINLDASFTDGALVNGYQLYSLTTVTDGIQNGVRDGFAIIDKRTSQVLQLISYEGTFTAAAGTPAAGLTSVSVGVSESNSTAENSSLGLTGSGGVPGAFTWAVSSGTNTKGSANTGQTFVVPTLPSQGLAIDNLSVTATGSADFDQDGIADSVDPDDDNDGQTDADEVAFGTDPLNAASVFKPLLARAAIPANGYTLTFPGAAGITYVVETSVTLGGWAQFSTHGGTGQLIVLPLALAGPARFYRVKAGQ